MSSTNFRPILIFASCVVGTRNILLYGDLLCEKISAQPRKARRMHIYDTSVGRTRGIKGVYLVQ